MFIWTTAEVLQIYMTLAKWNSIKLFWRLTKMQHLIVWVRGTSASEPMLLPQLKQLRKTFIFTRNPNLPWVKHQLKTVNRNRSRKGLRCRLCGRCLKMQTERLSLLDLIDSISVTVQWSSQLTSCSVVSWPMRTRWGIQTVLMACSMDQLTWSKRCVAMLMPVQVLAQ